MKYYRAGNTGIIDGVPGVNGLVEFTMGKSFVPSSLLLWGNGARGIPKMKVAGHDIVPWGPHNDMPEAVCHLLHRFYAAEGILSKITGLQWGQGPHLYEDDIDLQANRFVRRWKEDQEVMADLQGWTNTPDWQQFLKACAEDYNHMRGFFVKIYRNRAPRVGGPGRLMKLEHVPLKKCRLLYPHEGSDVCPGVMVADFPFVDPNYVAVYPMFNPSDPFRHPISMLYCSEYTFGQDFYAMPKFLGAWKWLELAGGLADILQNYNTNASSISLHIESPQSYWDKAEERIKEKCAREGKTYSPRMLEDFKDAQMKKFAENISGADNAGKYLHTTKEFDAEADAFTGWTITPVDKKLKDYVESQIKIANKADAAATSGFGLDPALANLIMENKLSSGSEKLYSMKVHLATETAIPDMIICRPLTYFIMANHPGTKTRVGFYRPSIDSEQNITPENRVRNTNEQ